MALGETTCGAVDGVGEAVGQVAGLLPDVLTLLLHLVFFSLPASSSSPRFASDLEQARPQTTGEEELQLQLALAMSREEAEKVGPWGRGLPHTQDYLWGLSPCGGQRVWGCPRAVHSPITALGCSCCACIPVTSRQRGHRLSVPPVLVPAGTAPRLRHQT